MAWSLPAMVAMILDIGFLVYAVAVSVIHYRLHDGARWIFILLCPAVSARRMDHIWNRGILAVATPRRESALGPLVR